MSNLITINNSSISRKIFKGQPVVTLGEIDKVHGRKKGTANGNFHANKERFSEGADYFQLTKDDISVNFPLGQVKASPRYGTAVLLTKSGYLMLAKTLTDSKAWGIQRELVDSYFNPTSIVREEGAEDRECQDCHRINAFDAIYCDKCGIVLKTQAQILSEKLRGLISACNACLPESQREPFRNTIIQAADYIEVR